MKSLTRIFLPEFFQNPITRNLILIFFATLFSAIFLVTAVIVLFNQ